MKDIKEKKDTDLFKLLSEKEDALRVFRFGVSGSKTRNVREGRAIRKDIARIKTELSLRDIRS